IGDDARADAAHEAAKSRDRSSDRPSRGGVVSVPAHAKIAIGVVVERRKAQSPWIDFTWRPVTALAGLPDAAPWTTLSQGGDGTTFQAGAPETALHPPDPAIPRKTLAWGALMFGLALGPTGAEPPYEFFGGPADPAEGEAWTEAGSDLVDVVPMPEAVRA